MLNDIDVVCSKSISRSQPAFEIVKANSREKGSFVICNTKPTAKKFPAFYSRFQT